MYVVKVLGHPKDKHRQFKYHTTFCIQQQTPDNTCDFYVCLNMVAFEAQLNCGVSKCFYFILLSMLMIKYAYLSFANTYFSFYHGRTMKILSLTEQVLASSILERG
jgi:hypothetical protein